MKDAQLFTKNGNEEFQEVSDFPECFHPGMIASFMAISHAFASGNAVLTLAMLGKDAERPAPILAICENDGDGINIIPIAVIMPPGAIEPNEIYKVDGRVQIMSLSEHDPRASKLN